jgi:hypothetical protein
LRTQQAFSGPRSTGISVLESGIYSPEALAEMAMDGMRDARFMVVVAGEVGKSVAQWFTDNNTRSRQVGAVTATYQGNANTVFYKSMDAQRMLHETLHVVTGLDDNHLAAALGIDISKFGGDFQLSSDAINKRLREKGCNL